MGLGAKGERRVGVRKRVGFRDLGVGRKWWDGDGDGDGGEFAG